MKPKRAAGPAGILPEFIKKWRSHFKTENISINNGDMDEIKIIFGCSEGILCPIYKKWDKNNAIIIEGYRYGT